MTPYAINEEQSGILQQSLADMAAEAEAEAVVLADTGGNILSFSSQDEGLQIDTVSALAAGAFAATRELAAMLREPGFHSIFHQGGRMSLFLQSVTAECIIVVIFGRKTTAGLVKLYVRKMLRELVPMLEAISKQDTRAGATDAGAFQMREGEDPFGRLC